MAVRATSWACWKLVPFPCQAHKAALEGDTAAAEALYAQTVDVTPEMAHELVKLLRAMVCCIQCRIALGHDQSAYLEGILVCLL